MEPSASALRFGKPRPITVSIGIASHRASEPIADLVARADSALYQAKGAGRNCIIACPEDFRASAEEAQDSGVRATRTTV
jgi:predicted signal transduction protein with EAL and GGDEF domain